MPFIRLPYWRERCGQEFVGEAVTEQSHRDLVDINNIVRRHARGGLIPPPTTPPQYADVTRLQEPLMQRMAFSEAAVSAVSDFVVERERAAAEAAVAPSPAPTPSPS